jgi:formamidopyrimidine-DNA glycosylase
LPELPEVETIRRDLTPRLTGKSFVGLTLHWPKTVQIPSIEAFERRLIGQTIRELDRRGKYLIFRLASGDALILHLRMSGSLLIDPKCEDDHYTRTVFHLDDGSKICFRDPRKLGVMWLVQNASDVVGKLGPEPLDPSFTAETLTQRVKKRSAPIKATLCDQSLIAGVGNMYADEALFAAGIHPLRPANSLSEEETKRLYAAVRQALGEAIDCCGASISDYQRPDGAAGTAQFTFKVAHRRGESCPACGTPIERIPIRQRGSYFCPRCQPYPGPKARSNKPQ